jgi:hypothetical protein
MYLRNAKQILRAGGFDERRYGFSGLIELLRACQREGLVRMERDRRGGLRVYHGVALARPAMSHSGPEAVASPAVEIVEEPPIEEAPQVEGVPVPDVVEDVIEVETSGVVDTTAELLGRAKPKRPRSRAASATQGAASGAAHGTPRGSRKTGTKASGGARRTRRSRKTAAAEDSGT